MTARMVGYLLLSGWLSAALLAGSAMAAVAADSPADNVSSGGQQALQQADAAIAARDYEQAATVLRSAINNSQKVSGSTKLEARLWRRLAFVSRLQGEHYAGIDQLQQALKLAREAPAKQLVSLILYDLGTSYLTVGDLDQSIDALSKSSKFFTRPYKSSLPIRVQINLAHALIRNHSKQGLKERLQNLDAAITQFKDKGERPELLLSLGRLYQQAQKELGLPARWRKQAFDYFSKARQLVDTANQSELNSYLDGFTGELYEDEHRYKGALTYTRRAVFNAQQSGADEALFKWQWQMGRLLRAQDNRSAALAAYRQAVGSLQKVRLALLMGDRSNFKRYIEPFYYQYFGLLLQQAREQQQAAAKDRLLHEVIDALEHFRVAELEDYFQNACVETTPVDQVLKTVTNNTAVIYPLVLANSIDTIVVINGHLSLYSTAVPRQRVISALHRFRKTLQDYRLQSGYLAQAKTLYNWLVKPFMADLQKAGIDTLVVVPDGPLRLIPMAALHDGDQYLIETMPVVTTPALSLTKRGEPVHGAAKLLATGITEAVQGYDALPSVNYELNQINHLYPAVTLKNNAFVLSRAKHELAQGHYSIIHMATHGEFNHDFRKSYLLTFDGKITMSTLGQTIGMRQFTGQPLDLLVLSACRTAVGDERAALGLAGVAVNAGARSAVATLWYINDAATSKLMSELYRQLAKPGVDKAQALRQAQLSLIHSKNRYHPYYWSPFLLIGDWQ